MPDLERLAAHYDVAIDRLTHIISLWEKHGLEPAVGTWLCVNYAGEVKGACAITVELLDAGVPLASVQAQLNAVCPEQTYFAFAAALLNRQQQAVKHLVFGFDFNVTPCSDPTVSDTPLPAEYRLGLALRAAVDPKRYAHVFQEATYA